MWQGQTLVIFYENLDSSYRNTRLGAIRDIENLKIAAGKTACALLLQVLNKGACVMKCGPFIFSLSTGATP
ncbi:hypothetical protein [Ottowia massiliensis]|uniref:hypothetical protein n=1 Tax=Ottowia massiliensis TaxID=2045302 RepID=UPI0013041249